MALSEDIISLLRALLDAELTIYFAIDAVEQSHLLFGERNTQNHNRYVEAAEEWGDLTGALAAAKLGPVKELNEEVVQSLEEIVGDERLDGHFTVLALGEVPRVVARWKKLKTVPVALLPGQRVTAYLRQASTCYLHGLPDAAAILCRAVLQFALEEAFATRGGVSLDLSKVDRKDYLEKLVNFAQNTRILSPQLATKAHRIRKLGNDSIHQNPCGEADALVTIKETGEVLSHIYGRSATSAR
jgi:hypothetical protein